MSSKLNKYLLQKKYSYLRLDASNFKTEEELLNFVGEKLNKSYDIIEFYAPLYSSKKLLKTAKKLRDLTAIFDAVFLIYDRIDIAKLTNADGIILDAQTINIPQAREILEDSCIGFFAQNEEEAMQAQLNNVDFVITHKNFSNIQARQFLI